MVVLFDLFLAALVFQLIAWVGIFSRVRKTGKLKNQDYKCLPTVSTPSVSLIICFRNEVERLQRHLPLILKQDYPHFEVIAVDDFSTDESAVIVKKLATRYPVLRLVQPPKPTRPGKKDALTFGISQAKSELILLTDADCVPASGHWITEMTAGFVDDQTEVILGYSPYRYRVGKLNEFQRYETVYTALQYFGFARAGMPYMGVGRNLAYRKSFFLQAGGLAGHAHIPGGDDDLLISHHAKAENTTLVTDPAAWTISDPAKDWSDYLNRKFRHVGVGGHYPLLPKLLLGGLGASHVGVYLFGISGLFTDWAILFLALLTLRWGVIVLIVQRSPFTGKTPESRPFSAWRIICNDALLAVYYLILLPVPLLGGRQKGGWE